MLGKGASLVLLGSLCGGSEGSQKQNSRPATGSCEWDHPFFIIFPLTRNENDIPLDNALIVL